MSAEKPEYIADSAEVTMAAKRNGEARILNVAPRVATVLVLGDLSAACHRLRRLPREEVSLDERSLDEAMAAQMHRDIVVEIDERAAASAAEQARLLARTVGDNTRIAQARAKRARKAAARRGAP